MRYSVVCLIMKATSSSQVQKITLAEFGKISKRLSSRIRIPWTALPRCKKLRKILGPNE